MGDSKYRTFAYKGLLCFDMVMLDTYGSGYRDSLLPERIVDFMGTLPKNWKYGKLSLPEPFIKTNDGYMVDDIHGALLKIRDNENVQIDGAQALVFAIMYGLIYRGIRVPGPYVFKENRFTDDNWVGHHVVKNPDAPVIYQYMQSHAYTLFRNLDRKGIGGFIEGDVCGVHTLKIEDMYRLCYMDDDGKGVFSLMTTRELQCVLERQSEKYFASLNRSQRRSLMKETSRLFVDGMICDGPMQWIGDLTEEPLDFAPHVRPKQKEVKNEDIGRVELVFDEVNRE